MVSIDGHLLSSAISFLFITLSLTTRRTTGAEGFFGGVGLVSFTGLDGPLVAFISDSYWDRR